MPDRLEEARLLGEAAHAAAEGEAALFLVEALMLTLADRGIVPPAVLVEALETAIAAKRQEIVEKDGILALETAGILVRVGNTILALSRLAELEGEAGPP